MNANAAKRKTQTKPKSGLVSIPVSQIKPSPENDKIYRPISPTDPEIVALAKSVKERGLLEPPVITADRYLVSGHRRHAAAIVAGLTEIPCRVLPIKRADDIDEFVRLLREHNRQREKTNAERLREEIITASEEDAVAELWAYRREKAAVNVKPIELGLVRVRSEISAAKQEFLGVVKREVYRLRAHWPLSDRRIHYVVFPHAPLRHSSKPDSHYRNDVPSYKDLTNLLTRARLTGEIPFEAIGDETRPVSIWNLHQTLRTFIEEELGGFLHNYYRDLMQSQTNHIEIIGEKNTVLPTLKPVAMEYTIPITTGRGYCSLPPRKDMADRYFASGKEKLVVLCVSDFDPEGVDIAESFARSMRDDFGISEIHAVKAALTQDQVKRFKLPPDATAKPKGSRYAKFVKKYGENVYELEALSPEDLQTLLRQHIEAVIDREAYSAEIEAERDDAKELKGRRNRVLEVLSGIDFDE